MQTTKMSLANIKGKLSRAEMKNIMAGTAPALKCKSSCSMWVGGAEGSMKNGTCSVITTQVGNVRIDSCDCSLSGGSDCNLS